MGVAGENSRSITPTGPLPPNEAPGAPLESRGEDGYGHGQIPDASASKRNYDTCAVWRAVRALPGSWRVAHEPSSANVNRAPGTSGTGPGHQLLAFCVYLQILITKSAPLHRAVLYWIGLG